MTKEKKFRIFGPNGFTYFDLLNVPKYVNRDNVEDYIGLKDKNGVEIYESDIVEYTSYSRVNSGIVLVKWEEEEVEDGFCGFWHGYNIDSIKVEVVGNIHENKVLLE